MTSHAPPYFLRLPAELRNRIYSEVLADIAQPFHLSEGHQAPAILSVCRQICQECSGLFYSTTTFQFRNPTVCLNFFVNMCQKYRELVSEVRYDCSETCSDAASWRQAFLDLPGLDQDCKLGKLRSRLTENGVFLRDDVLKAGIHINGRLVWTTDPLSEARDAVRNGSLVGKVMFM